MKCSKQEALDLIDVKREYLGSLSDQIWDTPETLYEEFKSAEILCTALEQEGFQVERNLADIATAFSGKWGSGHPVIGFLGEFDALPNLSQEANVAVKKPVVKGGAGHGCGHNLLGVGTLGAAIAVKQYLLENQLPGTVIFFGCPGEEGGSGKTFMARAGAFDDVDCALAWHPGAINGTDLNSSAANYQVIYRFHGISAHAGIVPQNGRSALDALELMNTGVQYLREHVPTDVKIHYAITNTGGSAPNVVQAEAEAVYQLRGKDLQTVRQTYERVNKVAQGAATMTETEVEIEFVKGCSNVIPNLPLAELICKNLDEVKKPCFSEEDFAFAAQIRASIPPQSRRSFAATLSKIKDPVARAEIAKCENNDIREFILPLSYEEGSNPGSTDVGDVSWVCPTQMFSAVTLATGTPGHTWQWVAQGKSHLAKEGMLYAARTLAGAAIDIIVDPELQKKIRADFDSRMNGQKYVCPIPPEIGPRIPAKGK